MINCQSLTAANQIYICKQTVMYSYNVQSSVLLFIFIYDNSFFKYNWYINIFIRYIVATNTLNFQSHPATSSQILSLQSLF